MNCDLPVFRQEMEVEHVEVTCPQGRLRGLVKKSEGCTETPYFSFQGIPYAKPPVGPLRFKVRSNYSCLYTYILIFVYTRLVFYRRVQLQSLGEFVFDFCLIINIKQ